MKQLGSLCLFALLILSSCEYENTKIIEKTKYRERNPIENVYINIKSGKLIITGWNENFIDINTEKVIYSGIKTDLAFLNTEITSVQKEKRLEIRAKKPDRIEGAINLTINLPYSIDLLQIETINADTEIEQSYSNIIYKGENGSTSINFKGSFMRIIKANGALHLTVDTVSPADMIINNDYGESSIEIANLSKPSYLDFKTVSGTVELDVQKHINYLLYALSDKTPLLNLTKDSKHTIFYNNGKLYVSKGKQQDLRIFIKNDSGSTIIK